MTEALKTEKESVRILKQQLNEINVLTEKVAILETTLNQKEESNAQLMKELALSREEVDASAQSISELQVKITSLEEVHRLVLFHTQRLAS